LVNESRYGKFQRAGKNKMLCSRLKRRVEKIIYLTVRVLYIDVRYVFVVGAGSVFVAVQSQHGLFRRQNAAEKQEQEICKEMPEHDIVLNLSAKIQNKPEFVFGV
jgi:hypothetical protein